uniref:NADH dehydrogenase subunit 5 n=1 Tax=Grandidierella taihuensis TaxID=2778875 RepID=UPI001BF1001C|nr:NADH dehydrogenase subunit 5 [Grandidierella taihuensis]QTX95229.1 NADH dehydrogenase subunit 5 [Grandidierella taihuensis]
MKFSNLLYKLFFSLLLMFSVIMFCLFMLSVFLNKVWFIEWELFNLNTVSVVMSLIFDWMSLSFLMVVSFISAMIMGYSIYYMEGDLNYKRFTFILIMFVISMMFLIISPNLISLLLGWDGLGLTSYALVIYYQNESSNNSGMITVLSNRIGDSALLVAIGLCFYLGGWNFYLFDSVEVVFMMLVILAAMTKSAQIPFSAWLPAAMAAPTPVSALVHSSTLVTAGVFLLVRFSFLMEQHSVIYICLVTGILTMLMAGWVANFENDLKKVIALSTLSQLGLMFMVLGLGEPVLAYFHLVMHALFKSTLFMCAGFVIHNMKGSQDSRFSGLFNFSSPSLGVVFSVTNLALCGFPFLAGFYSKDSVLENTFSGLIGSVLLILVVIATGLTVSYSVRVFFFSVSKASKGLSVSISGDFSLVLVLSVLGLFLLSILGGFYFSWLMIHSGRVFDLMAAEKFYVLLVIFLSVSMMYWFMGFAPLVQGFSISNYSFSSLMLFLPQLSSFFLSLCSLKVGVISSKVLDKGWLEYYGPLGVSLGFKKAFNYLQQSQFVTFLTQYMLFLLFLVIILKGV